MPSLKDLLCVEMLKNSWKLLYVNNENMPKKNREIESQKIMKEGFKEPLPNPAMNKIYSYDDLYYALLLAFNIAGLAEYKAIEATKKIIEAIPFKV